MLDGTLGLQPTIQLLTQQVIPPAVLPVAMLVKLLADWQADWLSSSSRWQGGSTRDWQDSPVVLWVNQHWGDMTAEQVRGLVEANGCCDMPRGLCDACTQQRVWMYVDTSRWHLVLSLQVVLHAHD